MVTILKHRKRLRCLCFMSDSSRPFIVSRWYLLEGYIVWSSTIWKVLWPLLKCHLTYCPGKTPSQMLEPHLKALGRSSPGFHRPVSRFCTSASFWSETAIFNIWRWSVKTRGSWLRKCLFPPVSLVFQRSLCFTSVSLLSFNLRPWNLSQSSLLDVLLFCGVS